MKPRRDTSEASAARFLALRAKPAQPCDPRLPDRPTRAKLRTTLQQILVGDEYRYRDVETGREYTASEARKITGPVVTRYVDGGVSFLARYIDARPGDVQRKAGA